jgi:hypothetical protein
MTDYVQVIVYCDARAVSEQTHWKQEVPDLATEVIHDFRLLGVQGTKRVYHCLVEKTDQLSRITDWITAFNVGKTDANKIWYWNAATAEQAYTNLWQDTELFAHAVAERVLRYPVQVEVEGEMVTILVSVYDAINTYGATIDPVILKQYGMPHKFFGIG